MGFRVRHGDIHHMGTWGLVGMGWKGTWVGKGTWGLGDMVQKAYTPFMGTWGLGDVGSRGHSTEGRHTFRVRHGEGIHSFHGDIGFRGHGDMWFR